ncbi:M66 family metalloprotease [Symbioplanes lichenis]|uniref:M66 family metalloprotease n=1 Tax=Symbioplanes lichenis TaxID=1629072 RepID=UPI002739ED14|nr:M66 family metalloprotease [Actinoplanes lichenis]
MADVDAAGVGGATYLPGHSESGEPALVIHKGMVVIDAGRASGLARGFGAAAGATTGKLLLHELGHAVGLAHPLVDDPAEVMYSRLTGRAAEWGAGDLAGLRAVGDAGGCLYVDPSPLAAFPH